MPGGTDAKTIFADFDADGSGQIDQAELGAALKAAGVEVTEEQVKELMKTIDTDGDGQVSLAEFCAFVGASKVLTKESVVKKMEATIMGSLKQASSPEDIALTVMETRDLFNTSQDENPRITNVESAVRSIKCWKAIMYMVACLILGLSLTAFVSWIYGLTMAPQHQGGDGKTCNEAAMWVVVLCANGLGQCIVMMFLKMMFKDSIRLAAMQGKKHWTAKVQSLLSTFNCVWLIYGVAIFFQPNRDNCPEDLWKFGFIYSIFFFVMVGLSIVLAIAFFRMNMLVAKLRGF